MSDRSLNPQVSVPEVRSRTGSGAGEERMRAVARMIEAEIVPRLLMSVSASPRIAGLEADHGSGVQIHDLHEFVRLLLAHDAATASAFLDVLRERGMPDEQVCLQLLAPAARLLGVFWERGACGPSELTLGLVRIFTLLQDIQERI